MGESKGAGYAVKGAIAAFLLILGAVHQVYRQLATSTASLSDGSVDEGVTPADKDFALFTHEKNELHCMERELRHPCVKELRDWVSDKSSETTRKAALGCVSEVLDFSTDYWELKNMTHLLLDLDTVDHVFDKESRSNDFVMLGVKFAEKLMENKDCIAEFETKNAMETRCVPLFGKIVKLKYLNAGMHKEAEAVYRKVSSMSYSGKQQSYAAGEAVPWDHPMHTPQIWVPGLRSTPMWPRETWKDLPICKTLEDNYATIREEAEKAVKNPEDAGFEDAYRFLYEKGNWDHVMLYHNRTFTEECDTVFPKTCAILRKSLPSKPGLPWTSNQNEQALVIKMKEGTDVEIHSGPANNILNIHMGIQGLEGARLMVAGKNYTWDEGKVIAWDGSYDHSVDCINCNQERVIIMVRYMHPDMTREHFKGIKKTHYEEVPAEMQ